MEGRVQGSRTQAERAEATQARILDAAIECLVENGYSGLTTIAVVNRAGISRGALAHHFPTRAALVGATADVVLAALEVNARGQLASIEKLTIDRALDVFWSVMEGDSFAALIELGVAGRTDPDLAGVFVDGPDRVVEIVMDVFGELFPKHAQLPFAEDAIRGVLAMYAGLAFQAMVDGDVHGRHARVRELFKSALHYLTSTRR